MAITPELIKGCCSTASRFSQIKFARQLSTCRIADIFLMSVAAAGCGFGRAEVCKRITAIATELQAFSLIFAMPGPSCFIRRINTVAILDSQL